MMMDTVSPCKRSWIMARVRSVGNRSTELKLVRMMRQHKIVGWRRNSALPGRPDFIFQQARVAVFVDGCFWHGHPTKCRIPKTNRRYWIAKIARNRVRDRHVSKILAKKGWKVVRIWEDAVVKPSTIARLRKALL